MDACTSTEQAGSGVADNSISFNPRLTVRSTVYAACFTSLKKRLCYCGSRPEHIWHTRSKEKERTSRPYFFAATYAAQ